MIAALIAIEVVGLTWLLNLTNFMDGIDGIVSIEAVTVTFACTALIVFRVGVTAPALLFALLGAIVLPFLCFNWSPAKIFMGDTGSGYLGFMIGVLALIAVARHQMFLMSPVILMGVFLSDATTTLITRMLRREQWLTPHRTHAYQILARRYGHSAGLDRRGRRSIFCGSRHWPRWRRAIRIAACFMWWRRMMPLVLASYVVRAKTRLAGIQ